MVILRSRPICWLQNIGTTCPLICSFLLLVSHVSIPVVHSQAASIYSWYIPYVEILLRSLCSTPRAQFSVLRYPCVGWWKIERYDVKLSFSPVESQCLMVRSLLFIGDSLTILDGPITILIPHFNCWSQVSSNVTRSKAITLQPVFWWFTPPICSPFPKSISWFSELLYLK